MESGQFEDVEDLLLQTLEVVPAIEDTDPVAIAEATLPEKVKKQNFSDFLLNSPLHRSGFVVKRIKDFPRPIDL